MNRDIALFDVFAPLYDRVMPRADAAALRKGLALAERDPECVIEVGGGSGRAARHVEATVFDPARGMLREARDGGLATVQARAESLPVCDGGVDAVLIVDALHHFADRQAALEEAARVLAPGGVLVVREFDRVTLRGALLVFSEQVAGFDSEFYSPRELRDAIAATGLEARIVERGFGFTVVGIRRDPR